MSKTEPKTTASTAISELTDLIAFYDDGRRWMRGEDEDCGWNDAGQQCFMVATHILKYDAAVDYLVKVSRIVLGTHVVAYLNDSCQDWETAKFCLEAARLLAMDEVTGQNQPRAAEIKAGYQRAKALEAIL